MINNMRFCASCRAPLCSVLMGGLETAMEDDVRVQRLGSLLATALDAEELAVL